MIVCLFVIGVVFVVVYVGFAFRVCFVLVMVFGCAGCIDLLVFCCGGLFLYVGLDLV